MQRILSITCLLLVAAGFSLAQTTADEQARRLLEDGRQYWARGQFKQALDNFNTIVSGFPGTDSVDNALLEVGRYYMEVEGDLAKARECFADVAKRFPQSDAAPGAYYYQGWITMNQGVKAADLDDALAQFDRLRTLYSRSDWVPRALYAAGLTQRKAGRYAEALDLQRRATLEYPTSDVAPVAQFEIGHCLVLLGDPRAAMEEFQRIRNSFAESEWAAVALERITALYRLYGGASPVFTLDRAYSVAGGDILKDVRAILLDNTRTLWVASAKTKSAVPFDRQGKMGSSLPVDEPRSLSLSYRGDVVLAARLAVRIGPKDIKSYAIPSDRPGVSQPLEQIAAAVVAPSGGTLVADEDRKRVYRFEQDQYKATFPDAQERKIVRMVLDGEGGIVMLDRDDRAVRVYDETGRLLGGIGTKGSSTDLRKPSDVAVDAARNLYVADEESGVLIFTLQGKLLTRIVSEEMRRPKALTLEPSGAILVYDDRTQRVLRFK